MSASSQQDPTPTQTTQLNYEILCPTLWLEAELRRNSEKSGVGGPNTRFTKSHEDVFWEEFERTLEGGVDCAGRDYVDFRNLAAEELRALVSEYFRRSTSELSKRLEDPRWNLGNSRDEIVEQILEELLSLREEVTADLQLHVAEGLREEEDDEVQEMGIEENRVSNLDRDPNWAAVVFDSHPCGTGCELDSDEELRRKL